MLRGNVADFPLVGILQMLQRDSRTGSVRLDYGQGAFIGVVAGKLVYAVFAPSKGERALSFIASFKNANFEFLENKLPSEQNIQRPTGILLLELHEENQQWKKIQNYLKNWMLAPQWYGKKPDSDNPERLKLIQMIDGNTSIEDILHRCDLPPRRSAEILIEFINERLVVLGSPHQFVQTKELMVLPIFSPDETTIFVDQTLYSEWKRIFGVVLATIVTPKGDKQMYRVKGRENSHGRVQVPDLAVKKLKIARGIQVKVIPSGGTR
ncbi:MAG: DUF4388 domain-containing protein [Deinococcales bacterium]